MKELFNKTIDHAIIKEDIDEDAYCDVLKIVFTDGTKFEVRSKGYYGEGSSLIVNHMP